jgi:hypothetical protein
MNPDCNFVTESCPGVPELAEVLAGVQRGVGGRNVESLLRGVLQRSCLTKRTINLYTVNEELLQECPFSLQESIPVEFSCTKGNQFYAGSLWKNMKSLRRTNKEDTKRYARG